MIGDTTCKVYCLVQGESSPFPVTPGERGVSDLNALVQRQLRNVDSADLVLWKVGLFNTQHKLADFSLVAPRTGTR